ANSEIEAIDISDDGNTIIACDQTEIWLSTDGGNNFADTDGGYNARDVAMSADGSKIVCVSTRMRMSTDGGATFNEVTSISNQQWRTVTMSADGTKIAGGTRMVEEGDIFTS